MYSSRRTTLLLLNWLLRENLPFHTVDTPAFEQVIKSLNPIASIPNSKSFLRLLGTEYEVGKAKVRELLSTARGMIHLSFDGWTSRQNTSFIGINVYFIDCHWKQWTFLLGLPPVKGRHRGIDIASHVADTIDDFGFASSVGYATLDNASSNTTCMEAMGAYFGFDPAERRISCAPHTINLVTKAMMYGTKRDNFAELLRTAGSIHPDTDIAEEEARDMVAADVQALNEALDEVISYEEPPELDFGEDSTYEGLGLLDDPIATSQAQVIPFPTPDIIDSASLNQYRKQGPGGKLHNIGVYLSRSSQLKMAFEKAQLDIDPGHELLSWVQNVPTRWESDEAMFERAFKLKYSLQRMVFDIERDWSDSGGLDVDVTPGGR